MGFDGHAPTVEDVKRALGIDSNDPNVKVRLLPMGAMGAMGDGEGFRKLLDDVLGGIQENMAGSTGVPQDDADVMDVCYEVVQEVIRARKKHAPMNSPHEAHSVILEEVEELWDEIKADRGRQKSARDEAIQVAAMAVRFILDIDPK